MSDILYVYGDNLYINLTNQCPCHCTFCIRSYKDKLGTAENLWLTHDPTYEEIIVDFKNYRLEDYKEIIFCGYGEPFCAYENLVKVAKYIRSITKVPTRINTNGLGDLINKKQTLPALKGLIDTMSISLNAPTAEKYNEISKPIYGENAFTAMLQFAKDSKQYVPNVKFSVVDVISPEDIAACQKIADNLQIPLRVRKFDD